MDKDRPLFILAGNGPYENRGCEAIVRGTVKILRYYFDDPQFICISHFQSEEQFQQQRINESDQAIVHLATHRLNKKGILQTAWKPKTWKAICQYFFNRDAFYGSFYDDMHPYIEKAKATLSVGGDNYSLDYGMPILFTALDNLVLSYKKPIILWGASVGPFTSMPKYEKYMSNHLKEVTGIFARESETTRYLENIGITKNVYHVADPAFVMDPVKPIGIDKEISISDNAIGLNFSPLMARYVTGGDIDKWTKIAASIISRIQETTEMPVYLIPHVKKFNSDDYIFMKNAITLLDRKSEGVTLIFPKYNAAETKWIISRMAIFAGARTHATIAALSSGIPTLSFGYSNKAWGINHDIFNHTDYCLKPWDLNPKIVLNQLSSMLDSSQTIIDELKRRIPKIQFFAMNGGNELLQIIGKN